MVRHEDTKTWTWRLTQYMAYVFWNIYVISQSLSDSYKNMSNPNLLDYHED
jgi:hypothetical protein